MTPEQTADALLALGQDQARISLTDAIDAFPVLRGMRDGIVISPEYKHPWFNHPGEFIRAAKVHGSGAVACASFIVALSGEHCDYPRASLPMCLDRIDTEHKAALCFVVTRWIRQGGF